MPEESRTPDLVELGRRMLEAANRRDLDAVLSFYAPDAVWETIGLGRWASYEELWVEQDEALDLGNGVAFGVLLQKGRPVGSTGEVRHRNAVVGVWVGGLIVRVTNYPDINEARAAAERLAEERG